MIVHEYETTLIYHPEAPEAEVKRITERVDGVIESFEGAKLFQEEWGLRRLAYPIRKQPRGAYHHFGFVASAPCIAEMERVLRIESEVMRFLTVRIIEDADLEERKLAASQRPSHPLTQGEEAEMERSGRPDRYRRPERTPRPPRTEAAEHPAAEPAPGKDAPAPAQD